jgi:hypothetical protein
MDFRAQLTQGIDRWGLNDLNDITIFDAQVLLGAQRQSHLAIIEQVRMDDVYDRGHFAPGVRQLHARLCL